MKKKKICTIFIPIVMLIACTIVVVLEISKNDSNNNDNNDNAQPINLKDVREKNNEKNSENEENDENKDIKNSSNNNIIVDEKETTNKENNKTTKNSSEKQEQNSNNKKLDNNNNNNNNNNDNSNDATNNNDNTTNDNVQKNFDESSKKEIIDSIREYYCEDPFKLNGTKCEYTLSVDALTKYTCETGTLNGTKCDTTTSIEHVYFSQSAKEYCNSLNGSGMYERCLCQKDGGTYNSNTQKCFKSVKTQTPAIVEHYCTADTTLYGNKCQKHYETNALYKLSCPSGYNLNNFQCEK